MKAGRHQRPVVTTGQQKKVKQAELTLEASADHLSTRRIIT